MSEPVRLGEIVPGVLRDIESRCNRYRQEHGLPLLGKTVRPEKIEHTKRTFGAIRDFMATKGGNNRRNRQRQPVREKALF